mmetsp:Transcript_10693/g.31308  ORF Transcript_10693/g.31308 Transcript_10693/m.31308 type:complete len:255 (+) Transcript_10693:874-1638(+)
MSVPQRRSRACRRWKPPLQRWWWSRRHSSDWRRRSSPIGRCSPERAGGSQGPELRGKWGVDLKSTFKRPFVFTSHCKLSVSKIKTRASPQFPAHVVRPSPRASDSSPEGPASLTMAAARRVSLPPCGARAAPSRRRGWRGAPYRQRQPANSLRLPPGVRLSRPPPPPASPPPPVTADQTPRPPAAPARASRRRPVAAEAASSRLQRRPSQRIEVWVRIALWSPPRPTAAGAGLASSSLRRRPRQAQRRAGAEER